MKTFMLAVLSILLSVAAQFSLKAGMSSLRAEGASGQQPWSAAALLQTLSHKYVLLGFLLYGLGALVWLLVLAKWDVSKAYPLVGLGFVLTLVVGYMLGEQVTAARLAGVVLISVGVLLVGRS
jgi:multidrug transporter EmrE-like cation transporter